MQPTSGVNMRPRSEMEGRSDRSDRSDRRTGATRRAHALGPCQCLCRATRSGCNSCPPKDDRPSAEMSSFAGHGCCVMDGQSRTCRTVAVALQARADAALYVIESLFGRHSPLFSRSVTCPGVFWPFYGSACCFRGLLGLASPRAFRAHRPQPSFASLPRPAAVRRGSPFTQ